MNKFSHLLSINESTENTFLLGKNVDNISDSYMEVLDIIETLKDSYPDTIERVSIEKGYATDYNLSRVNRAAHATQIVGRKKIKQYFPSGNIPDKWIPSIKTLIEFKKLDGESFDPSVLDKFIDRYKSVKALSSRCNYYGAKVQVSFGSSMNRENISVLVFFE